MAHKAYLSLVLVVLGFTGEWLTVDATAISTCNQHMACLVVREGACSNTRRNVCLLQNSQAPSSTCPLNDLTIPTSLTAVCSVSSANSPVMSGQIIACDDFEGGSIAKFRVDGGSAASGLSTTGTLNGEVNTDTLSRQSTCIVKTDRVCPRSLQSEVEWTFAVTSCNCTGCGQWSSWSSCSAVGCAQGTRMRTRSGCQSPRNPGNVVCSSSESESCTNPNCDQTTQQPSNGCTCSSTWGSWSTCSSTCIGGMRMRRRTCMKTNPNSNVVCNDLVENSPCGTAVCAPTGGRGNCHCSEWRSRGCSVPCGRGLETKTRFCNSGCGPNTITSITVPCGTSFCGPRRPARKCNRLRTRAARRRCRMSRHHAHHHDHNQSHFHLHRQANSHFHLRRQGNAHFH